MKEGLITGSTQTGSVRWNAILWLSVANLMLLFSTIGIGAYISVNTSASLSYVDQVSV